MLATNMDERQCLLVIFGASGDLTRRKLIPGLFELHVAGLLSSHVAVLGISRTPLTDDEFRDRMKGACQERRGFDEGRWREFAGRLHYLAADATHAEDWPRISQALCQQQVAHGTGGEILYYLSVAPELCERIIQNIGAAQLSKGPRRWCAAETNPSARQRIIVEKPFGHDLPTAEHLNRVLGRVFDDEDVFASTTTWARRRCRTCSSSASPTCCSSRCGTGCTSITYKSRQPKPWAWAVAQPTTIRPGQCAT